MREETYVIAYCGKAEQYYRLKLDRDEKTILDFALSRRKAVNLQPVPRGMRLETAQALRACPVCGSRTAGKCSCMVRSLPCERNIGFRFPCVYCREMQFIGVERI